MSRFCFSFFCGPRGSLLPEIYMPRAAWNLVEDINTHINSIKKQIQKNNSPELTPMRNTKLQFLNDLRVLVQNHLTPHDNLFYLKSRDERLAVFKELSTKTYFSPDVFKATLWSNTKILYERALELAQEELIESRSSLPNEGYDEVENTRYENFQATRRAEKAFD